MLTGFVPGHFSLALMDTVLPSTAPGSLGSAAALPDLQLRRAAGIRRKNAGRRRAARADGRLPALVSGSANVRVTTTVVDSNVVPPFAACPAGLG